MRRYGDHMITRLSALLAVIALLSSGCSSGGDNGGHGGAAGGGTAGNGARGGSGGGAGSAGTTGVGGGGRGGGGSAGTGAGGTTGLGGRGGGAGTGGTGGISSTGSGLVDLVDGSAGMTIAVDAAGAIHVATATLVQGTYGVAYGRCAGQCDRGASWTFVVLPLESDTSHVPTVALTSNGRPRIAYASDLGAAPGYHYLECDAGCEQPANWHDVRLTMGDPGASPAPRPSLPFAVSPGGAAAFAYDDGFGMYAWTCKASCAVGTSWTRVTLADVYIYAESIAFASDSSLQVVARHAVRDTEGLLWLDCNGDCAVAANWTGLDNVVTTQGMLQAVLARTSQGGTRILFYGDNPGTSAPDKGFGWLACDSNCRTASNWTLPLQLGIPANFASVGFSMVLDAGGRPAVAILADTTSSFARCTGDCTGAAGVWTLTAAVSVSNLNAGFAPAVPASCTSASWGMYVGPSVALDSASRPIMALTANAKGFGGACGTGSAATMTDSFLALP